MPSRWAAVLAILAASGCGGLASGASASDATEGGRADASDAARPDAHDAGHRTDARPSADVGTCDAGVGDALPPPICGIPAFGAPAVGSACTPDGGLTTLATFPSGMGSFKVDEGALYVPIGPGFGWVPKSGGSFIQLLAPPAVGAAWSLIAFDADAVYVGSDERYGIVRIPKVGGCATALKDGLVSGLAVDDAFVYYISSGTECDVGDRVERMAKTGPQAPTIVVRSITGASMSQLLLVGSRLFWIEGQTVCSAMTSGASAQVVYPGGTQIMDWAADPTGVYVLGRVGLDDDLFAVPFPPLAPTRTLLTGASGGGGSVADGVSLYWPGATTTVSGILKTDEASGTTTVVVDQTQIGLYNTPTRLQLDSSCVYWAKGWLSGGAAIMSVSR